MTMPSSAAAISGRSNFPCCQIDQAPPATARSNSDTEKPKAEFSLASLGTGPSSLVAVRETITHPLDSSPPNDVQSLFCTFLI
jgi:hypothetical protein